ncbi:MAG: hydantoinase B/oxoprolinase family protein [Acidobacteriota bacterium]
MIGPVELELFTHRFEAIAREMGEMLQRTAVSTNIRERLDFSCAVLDADGRLVANAPHIPVHLGALGLCVRKLMAGGFADDGLRPGDAIVTNHPAWGGSHLPDVTVVSPVFAADERIGFVANRAHHAEIGGSRPGSMPPDARCLAEEGVVLEPFALVRDGISRWPELRRRMTSGPFPTRSYTENVADLHAALAANGRGAAVLAGLAAIHGNPVIRAAMTALASRSGTLVERALASRPAGRYEALHRLDDGAPIRVAVDLEGGRARIDFTGTGPVHRGNLNAPPAVVQSAVLYVLRLLVDEPLPLNEGLMKPVRLIVPEGMLNPPFPADPLAAPAVVGGNVETSQRVVDTLIEALSLAAGSQGTMNNVLFGNERFGYYETVGGGAGAGPGFAGADAVHSHMTNTRITDPEILEHRYPVRLERFAVRRGSGGAGRFRGGDGIVREMTFLQPVELSLLSQRRSEGPAGAAGGGPGSPGRQRLRRADGSGEDLPGIAGRSVMPGDRLVLETPGGGGWGGENE